MRLSVWLRLLSRATSRVYDESLQWVRNRHAAHLIEGVCDNSAAVETDKTVLRRDGRSCVQRA
jgi:hypothetical protein